MKLLIITIVLAVCMLSSTLGDITTTTPKPATNPTTKPISKPKSTTASTKSPTASTTTTTAATKTTTTAATKTTTPTTTTKKTTPTTTTKKTTLASTTKKTTLATTPKKTTLASTTKKTTLASTTKKTTLPTTTEKTTLATTPKSTSTPKTTTTPKKTTTNAPTTPSPTDLNFVVSNKNGTQCLWLKGEISVTANNEVIDLTRKGCAAAGGKCSDMENENSTSSIVMTCTLGSNGNSTVTVTIGFNGGDIWFLSSIKAVVVANNVTVESSASYGSDANGKLFQAQRNHSYTCSKDHELKLKNNVTVDFKKVSIQPFAAYDGKSYENAVACPSGVNPNPDSSIVPIAVGCALAGLIVIVLIAYLIGRRKGGNRGYQKV